MLAVMHEEEELDKAQQLTWRAKNGIQAQEEGKENKEMSPNDYNYCGEVLRTLSATTEEDVCIIDLFSFIVQW